MSDNGRAPGRMHDTLLPIPDAEYPAFYPIGIKASCVYSGPSRTAQSPQVQAMVTVEIWVRSWWWSGPIAANRQPSAIEGCDMSLPDAVRDISAAEASESIAVWPDQSVTVPVRPLPTENSESEMLNLNLAYFTESLLATST
jgi:hypothetical protein